MAFDLKTAAIPVALGKAIARGAGVIAFIVLANVMPKDEWNQLALLLSFYIVGLALGPFGFHQGLLFFFGHVDKEDRPSIARQATYLLAAGGFLTALILVAVSPWAGGDDSSFATMMRWLALALALELPAVAGVQLLLAVERTLASAVYEAASALAQTAALTIPIFLGFGPLGVVKGLCIYGAVRLVAYLWVLRRVTPSSGRAPPSGFLKRQIDYGLPLGLAVGTAALNRNVDKWIVQAFDPDRLGTYAIATQEIPLIPLVAYTLGAVLATRIVHGFHTNQLDRVRDYWLGQICRTTLFVIPSAVGLILCGPELIQVFFGARYAEAGLPFQIYSATLFNRVAEYGLILRAAGRPRLLWLASAMVLGLNLAISIPLTWRFGIVGTASGTLAANILAWLVLLTWIAALMKTPVRKVFPWLFYGQVLVSTGLIAVGVGYLGSLADLNAVGSLAFKIPALTMGTLVAAKVLGWRQWIPAVPEDDPDFEALNAPPTGPDGHR